MKSSNDPALRELCSSGAPENVHVSMRARVETEPVDLTHPNSSVARQPCFNGRTMKVHRKVDGWYSEPP